MPIAPRLYRVAALLFALAPAEPCSPVQAQVLASSNSCATLPDDGATNIRAIAGSCGAATFDVDVDLRQLGSLRVRVDGDVYIRAIRLSYQSSGGMRQQSQLSLHRMLLAGEASDSFPTTQSGLPLVSVTVDANPPGYGATPVVLTLVGPEGQDQAAPIATGSVQRSTGDRWMLVGSTQAHLANARDTIVIGRDKGRFDGLVIGSRGGDLAVKSVIVSPFDGAPFTVDVQGLIGAGNSSGVISIDPPDFLHEITVVYASQPSSGRAPTLEVRGHYDEDWLGSIGENRQYAGGWVMLGTADIIAIPHTNVARDKLLVVGQDGPFKKLRFVARRGAVSLSSVVVDAGNGRQETVPVNAFLMPDVVSAPVALQSGAVPIDRVTLSPQIRPSSRIDATVEVWAQY